MPVDHVGQYEQRDAGAARISLREGKRSSQGGRRRDDRRRMATATSPPAGLLSLSPLLYNLPSLSGMGAFKGYLPNAVTNQPATAQPEHEIPPGEKLSFAKWQHADLHDGHGDSALLVTSCPRHALRVFRQPLSSLSDSPDAKEELRAAEEIISIPVLHLDPDCTVLPVFDASGGRKGQDSKVRGRDWETVSRDLKAYHVEHAQSLGTSTGASSMILLLATGHKTGKLSHALAVLDLQSGLLSRWRDIHGSVTDIRVDQRNIALISSEPFHLHLLDTKTLESLPVSYPLPPTAASIALSGRLVAYTTDEEPRSLGTDGLGTLIASRRRVSAKRSSPALFNGLSTSHQSQDASHAGFTGAVTASASTAAILSSAAGYGGMAARGLAAGLKKGAQMAQRAQRAQMNTATDPRADRLAKSAPVEGSLLVDPEADAEDAVETDKQHGARSRTEHVPTRDRIRRPLVRWIKIVDFTRDRIIAHFQLPPAETYVGMLSPDHRAMSTVSLLSFSPDGTRLLAAQADGRACHVLQIHPSAAGGETGGALDVHGQVYHMYELKRGNTPAEIKDVVWDTRGRWIGVISGHGTIHIYPIHPSGAIASAASHLGKQLGNPSHIAQLSTPVSSVARLRSHDPRPDEPSAVTATAIFTAHRADPLRPGRYIQDIAICRPDRSVIELIRLHSSKRKIDEGHAHRTTSSPSSNLAVDHKLVARWYLPDCVDDVQLVKVKRPARRVTPVPLAQAEIRTCSTDSRILPKTIYLSGQFAFYSARSIDDHVPLSIIDREARQHRLAYRAEIAPRSDPASYTDPLSTALQTTIPSPSHRPIPGLPNGQPGSWGSSLPRHVAHGVGEGLDRFKEHYAHARAQAARRQRHGQGGEALSFDEGAVFPSIRRTPDGRDLEGEDGVSEDELLPGLLSDRGSGSASVGSSASHGKGDHSQRVRSREVGTSPVEAGWGDRDSFEKEYDAAVRDEEPDDLILGVMDELGEVDDMRTMSGMGGAGGRQGDEPGWATGGAGYAGGVAATKAKQKGKRK